jgi:hypothetical protein
MHKKLHNSSPNIIRMKKSARMTSEGHERRETPKIVVINISRKKTISKSRRRW